MSNNKSVHHRRWYRVIAISLAYLLFGAALFVPLGSQKDPNLVLLIVLGSIWFVAWIASIVVNEIIIAKKYGGKKPKVARVCSGTGRRQIGNIFRRGVGCGQNAGHIGLFSGARRKSHFLFDGLLDRKIPRNGQSHL